MLRDDVLMKQIRQMVEGLLRAARLRKERNLPAAEATADDLLERQLGLSPRLVEALAPASLLGVLSPGGEVDGERCVAVALVLAEKARARGGDEALREKAAVLLRGAGHSEELLDLSPELAWQRAFPEEEESPSAG